MPILRIAEKLVYFAHVPKCAGTAIELYLQEVFGPLAFRDTGFRSIPARRRWSKTSPQHVDAETVARLFPTGFFDHQFAVVRHPVDRLVSVFRFQRDIENSIDPEVSLDAWIAQIGSQKRASPWRLDNHIRPMVEMVPEDAQVFRLEDGLPELVQWLASVAGPTVDLPPDIPVRNSIDGRLRHEGRSTTPVVPDPATRATIEAHYAADFERFGYEHSV